MVKAEVRDFVQSVDGPVVFANGRGWLRNLEDRGGVSSFHGKGEGWRYQIGYIQWSGRKDFFGRVGSAGAAFPAPPARGSAWSVCVFPAQERMLLRILYAMILAFASLVGLSTFRRPL